MRETRYRIWLDWEATIEVRFTTCRTGVTDYAIVLVVENGERRAVRVYDNTHETHDMHRYNREGVKQAAETFHRGSAGEAMRSAIEMVCGGYREMTESWQR